MAHVFSPKNKDKLISEERREIFKPKKLLKFVGLKEGMTVFDVGCGNGFFTLPAAEIVGDNGNIFGFDLSQEMLNDLKSRVEKNNINNIKTFLVSESGIKSTGIKFQIKSKANFMIMSNILHEVPNLNNFLDDYLEWLSDGGRLLIIEWRKKETAEGPGLEHRLAPKDLLDLLNKKGLKALFSRIINNNYYLKLLEK